jgi:hypothetical protein
VERLRLRRVVAVVSLAVLAGSFPARALPQTSPPGVLPAVVAAVAAAQRGAAIPEKIVPPIDSVKMFPRRFRIPHGCIAHDSSSRTMSRVCRTGVPSSDRLLVLFGDSHAFMWLPAVLQMARRDNWAVVPLIRFGCTPDKWFTHTGPDVCRAWFRWGITQIRRLHPAVTLLGGSIGERPSAETSDATAGVIAAARTLEPLGPLVVIGDPEGMAADPIPCVAGRSSLARCMTTWPPTSLVAYDSVAREMGHLRIGFLPTRGFVCYARQCPAVVGHTIVWMDNNHLTGIYSAQVAGAFRAAFLRALR